MNYSLRAYNDDRTEEWSCDFEAEELPRVLTRLSDFLRAVGFTYVDGMSVLSKGKNNDKHEWKYWSDDAGEYEPL